MKKYSLLFLVYAVSGINGMAYANEYATGTDPATNSVTQPSSEAFCDAKAYCDDESGYDSCLSDIGSPDDYNSYDEYKAVLQEVRGTCCEDFCGSFSVGGDASTILNDLQPADGDSAISLVVNAKDAQGVPLPGIEVKLLSDSSFVEFVENPVITDASGKAHFSVTNTVAQNVTVTPVVGTVKGQPIPLNFTPNVKELIITPVKGDQTVSGETGKTSEPSLSDGPQPAPADGDSAVSLLVTPKDANGHPLPNVKVELVSDSATAVITENPVITNAEGEARFSITNTVVETVAVTPVVGTLKGQPIALNFTPNVKELVITPVKEKSTGANRDAVFLSVTARNEKGPVAGIPITVQLPADSSAVVNTGAGVTDKNGELMIKITSTVAGDVPVVVGAKGTGISESVTVPIAVTPAVIKAKELTNLSQVADGQSQLTIVIVPYDAQGSAMAGVNVELISTSETVHFENNSITTNSRGEAQFAIGNTVAETVTLTPVADGIKGEPFVLTFTPVITSEPEVVTAPDPIVEAPQPEPVVESTPVITTEVSTPSYEPPAPSFFGDYADHWVKANPYYSATFNLGIDSSSQTLILYPSRNSEIVDNHDGTLTYTVNPNFRGVDTFTYTLTDAKGSVSVFVVKVQVSEDYTGYDVWDFDKNTSGMDYSGNQGNGVYIAWPPGTSCDVIYAVNDQGVADSQLLYIDPDKRTTTAFGPIHKGYDIESLEISPSNYRLYGVASSKADKDKRGRLYLVDPNSGELTVVGNTGFDDINALAFRYDGTLWGWASGKGIIQIDTDTGHGYVRVPFKTVNAEGLAWSSDGKFLYASEGTTLWWWQYGHDSTVSKKCQNLPGEVEALETLDGGMLMFAIDQDVGHKLYAYDPWACKIVDDRSFVTSYSDIEGIAWTTKCEPQPSALPPVESWTGAFNDDTQTNLYCHRKAGLLTVTGEVSLYPSESQAFIQTNWQTVWFGTDSTTGTDSSNENEKLACSNAPAPYDVDCLEPHYDSEIISDTFKFKITGWWPGVPKNADSNTMIGTYFSVDVLNMKGDPVLWHQNISRNFVWIDSLCGSETDEEDSSKTSKPKTSENPKAGKAGKDKKPTEATKSNDTEEEGDDPMADESSPTAPAKAQKLDTTVTVKEKSPKEENSTDQEKTSKDKSSKTAKDKQNKSAKEKGNKTSNKADKSAKDTEAKTSNNPDDSVDSADKEEKRGTTEEDKQDKPVKDKAENTATGDKSAKDSSEETSADKQDKSAKDSGKDIGDDTATDKQDKSAKDSGKDTGDDTATDKQDKSAKDSGEETAADKQDKSAKDNGEETTTDKQDKSAKDNGSTKDNGEETTTDKQNK